MIIDSEVESIHSRDLLLKLGESLFDAGIDADFSISPEDDFIVREEAIDALTDALEVERVNSTFVVDIRFEADMPEVAAAVVNQLMEEFRLAREEVLATYLDGAGNLLQAQIDSSDAEVAKAERRIEEFRTQFQVESNDGRGMLEGEIADTDEDLLRIEAVIQELDDQINAIDNAVVNVEALTLAKLDDLASATDVEAGPLRSRVIDLQDLVASDGSSTVREALSTEIATQLGAYSSRLKARRDAVLPSAEALERRRGYLSSELSERRNNLVDMRGLERQARALESRHIALLAQLQDTRQASTLLNPVRVLQAAVPPLEPSSMSPKMLLAISILLGLMAGIGFALLREQVDSSFRSSRQLEEITGTKYLGAVPVIRPTRIKRIPVIEGLDQTHLKRFDKKELIKLSFAARYPDSRFAKTVDRSIFEIETTCGAPANVAILSCVGDEGKTLFVCNLGFSLGKRGRRVLIADLDKKNRGLSKVIGNIGFPVETEFDAELSEVGAEYREITPNLYAVCFKGDGPRNTSKLLPLIQRLQEAQSEPFDFTILDTPPIAYLPETLEFARFSDASIMVVRWGRTRKGLASRLLNQNRAALPSLIGAVMSQTDSALFDRYEHLPDSQHYYVEP
ncbi:hypothetical protein N9L47_04260 [Rhodobacteraceae bacterium]|nr:hypothetical protein [Paracoccaceae bacterium]